MHLLDVGGCLHIVEDLQPDGQPQQYSLPHCTKQCSVDYPAETGRQLSVGWEVLLQP